MSTGTTFERGEPLKETDKGPFVARVESVSAGEGAVTLSVNWRQLRNAVSERLRDSYNSVYLWCDGNALAVTDHHHPRANAPDVDELADLDTGVHREKVVKPHEDAQAAEFNRQALLSALDALDAEKVRVVLEEDFPIMFLDGDSGTSVAPIVRQIRG